MKNQDKYRNISVSQERNTALTSFFSVLLLCGFILFASSSCRKDFEELNMNPQGFTTATDGSLLNQLVKSLILGWNEQFYINNEVLYKQTQLAALGEEAWGNLNIGTEEVWKSYYNSLAVARELESRFALAEPSGELDNMKAIVKTILAYKTFKMTDLFGDIPFFEAGWGYQNLDFLRPPYDAQEDIYLFLFDELQWVNEHIDESAQNEPFQTFRQFDAMLSGDLSMWKKFANTIRLKQAIRMYDKAPELAGNIIATIVDENQPLILSYFFTSYKGENVLLRPSNLGYQNDAVSWSFREHRNLRMGSNIWNQLSNTNAEDGSGIFDLRAYYFFETNNSGSWRPFPQVPFSNTPAIGGFPYQTHRDNNFTIKGEQCIYSPFNYFLTRDADNIPEIIQSGSDVHFMLSEVYFRGMGIAADPNKAEDHFMLGLEGSFRFWSETMQNSILPTNLNADFNSLVNPPASLTYSYLLNEVGWWNFTSDNEKLQMIYTQRWINQFRQVWEAFALCRRVDLLPREGQTLDFYRLPYPPSEEEYNRENFLAAIANGGNLTSVKLWWMP